ncbi:trafficking protein particle complex subunit 10 isoform X2 [Copidosoma floridanum]|uniref:trafficking protein particle complex subunit 10 isoform X2 n=1 Tax=Copidosoma floridanum TaxID=29053 RepID=UPI0006C9BBFC|nr:trafficking protein particle complex subunit 10 isoform X2 [Copidosoma floridanum]
MISILSICTMTCTTLYGCAGDIKLLNTLADNLVKSIPTDSVEWRRSFDRPIKQVKLCASFVPFSQDVLPSEKDCHLIKRPIFHIYWSECSDVDVYKASLKDDIDSWFKTLAKAKIQDWMIVLVETYDIKKSNKLLPRTTVLDKIRSDFAAKHGDRCLSIINPIKSESRSAESWRGLITRIRHLMLTAYDRTLLKFEEIIREHREKRNQPGWNFCHYFLLQEELAFVLEMLGLYDEALVQYDELDALFTQFILNSNVGDTPAWLSSFQSPLNKWSGVKLNTSVDYQTRIAIAECKASLLDLRSYLFSRQCAMLLSLNKHWEIAQRCLSFVHDTINELRILEIQRPEGSVECWAFLCALEVLKACQSSNVTIDNSQLLDLCSLHTATLWALARDKLESLGKLCGLMPGNEPISEQLHTVVYLIAGMGDSELKNHDPKQLTPTDKLKEALSSKEAFKKQYLHHTELAMGTYKHVKRNRSARLIGKELARFYSDLNENQKAVVFLLDALQTYTSEGWTHLAAQTQHELAQCYKKMDDVERYTKICATIASSQVLHLTIRNSYLDEMLAYTKMLKCTEPLLTDMANSFVVEDMEVSVTDKVIQDCEVKVKTTLKSLLPRPVTCTRAELSVEEVQKPNVKRKGAKGTESIIEVLLKCRIEDRQPSDPCLVELPVTRQLILQEDRSIGSANVQVGKSTRSVVKRSDSVKLRKPSTSASTKGDFGSALSTGVEEIILQPGLNTLTLTKRVEKPGYYRVNQLSVIVEEKLEFLSSVLQPQLCYSVAKTQPTIALNCTRDLLAGLVQSIELVISSGSIRIGEGSKLKLRTLRGLTLSTMDDGQKTSSGVREIEVTIPKCEPFDTITLKLMVLAELPPKKDSSSMEHKLNIQCPWGAEESITLYFGTPLMSTMKLHTAKRRKFVQIVVIGLAKQLLQLTDPRLTSGTSADVQFRSLNPTAGQKLIIGNGMSVSFMWEVEIGNEDERSPIPIKTEFRVKYIAIKDIEDVDESNSDEASKSVVDDPLHIRDLEKVEKESNVYWCNFDVTDYSTLFMVSSKVEAIGSSGEFCRAGSMCHLCLTVTRMQQHQHHHPPPQLMYEVLADQTMWAVCGRTAGIVSLEVQEKQSVALDVMPLTSGYLPLPVVRLSRYIPAAVELKNGTGVGPRLEPFRTGQVYNASKALQIHVLPAAPLTTE